ncbi:hypothetical protein E4U53_007371 [Claviceps sorghi]|nr:hypothetical protein E4U53_007371 [Claviceps sorghi]
MTTTPGSMPCYKGVTKRVIVVDVEPGEVTGIYYMPICNLPFGTSWQDFKDWLRVGCDVDHVELFQSSTSGWIRLRGEENFNKAWTRLKEEYFRNRAIIASDKNRSEAIKVKRLIDGRMARFGTPVRWELAASQAHHAGAMLSPARSGMREAVLLTSPLGPDGQLGRLPASISWPVRHVGSVRSNPPAFGYYEPAPPHTSGLMPAAPFSNGPSYGPMQPDFGVPHLPPHRAPGTRILDQKLFVSRYRRPDPGKPARHASAAESAKPPRRADVSRTPRTSCGESPATHASRPPREEGDKSAEANHLDGPVIAWGSSICRICSYLKQ